MPLLSDGKLFFQKASWHFWNREINNCLSVINFNILSVLDTYLVPLSSRTTNSKTIFLFVNWYGGNKRRKHSDWKLQTCISDVEINKHYDILIWLSSKDFFRHELKSIFINFFSLIKQKFHKVLKIRKRAKKTCFGNWTFLSSTL